jgi:hypothetical protein
MTRWLLLAGLAWVAGTACAQDPYKRMSGAAIRKAIVGKEITDGFHYTDQFGANGKGTFITLGRRKEGKWEIKDDQLCMVSHSRTSDAMECFELWRDGDRIQYRLPGNGPALAEGKLQRAGK